MLHVCCVLAKYNVATNSFFILFHLQLAQTLNSSFQALTFLKSSKFQLCTWLQLNFFIIDSQIQQKKRLSKLGITRLEALQLLILRETSNGYVYAILQCRIILYFQSDGTCQSHDFLIYRALGWARGIVFHK